jgi:hypothetical protein
LVSVTVSILPATSFLAPRKSKLACTPVGKPEGEVHIAMLEGTSDLRTLPDGSELERTAGGETGLMLLKGS